MQMFPHRYLAVAAGDTLGTTRAPATRGSTVVLPTCCIDDGILIVLFVLTINGAWAEYLLVPDARANLAPVPAGAGVCRPAGWDAGVVSRNYFLVSRTRLFSRTGSLE
jgi:hypothetical protein